MCGIFCYIGNQNVVNICLNGIKSLEYRGYDSFGLAALENGKIWVEKKVGPITSFQTKESIQGCGIAHTRWATHGRATEHNAHPQLDENQTLALVHNGVIENYRVLKESLIEKGIHFSSETDTEVIAGLIAYHYKGDPLVATLVAIQELEGSFAFAFIHKDHPDQIIAAASHSPLTIGCVRKTNEIFVSSDPNAFYDYGDLELFFLEKGEVALLKKGMPPQFYSKKGDSLKKQPKSHHLTQNVLAKGEFSHFMLKEMYEQQETVRKAMLQRIDSKNQTAIFEGLNLNNEEIEKIKEVVFIGCGTSYHAGYVTSYLLGKYAGVPAKVEFASEFRYKEPTFSKNTLFIALSQSGETADTLAAAQLVKERGGKVIGLCNVRNSTLERLADGIIFLEAGPEQAVASTKTFTSQLVILYLFTLLVARVKGLEEDRARLLIKHLYEMPVQVIDVLNRFNEISGLAEKFVSYDNFFFLGRGLLYPIALEGALKLKEIAYINAQGYPAGEMKHGPIALLNAKVPVIGLCGNRELQSKMMSNLKECQAREAPIIIFGLREFEKEILEITEDVFWIPSSSDDLSTIPLAITTQLFAYEVARLRGESIDKPRNLAKSVTVE